MQNIHFDMFGMFRRPPAVTCGEINAELRWKILRLLLRDQVHVVVSEQIQHIC